jgi:hypothetical protein
MAEMFRRVVRERLRWVGKVVNDTILRWPGRPPVSVTQHRELTEAEAQEREATARQVIEVVYRESVDHDLN